MSQDAKPQKDATPAKKDEKPPVPVAKVVELGLRDYFAASALHGLLAHPGGQAKAVDTAREAYEYADAMLAARPKGEA